MATQADPSGQLMAQNTESVTKTETVGGPAAPATKPPPKKPTMMKNCELCNVILTSQSIVDAHMASKKHKKKLQAAESMKVASLPKRAPATNSPLFRCDICNITLNSFQQKEFHLAGTKHNYKVKKIAESNEGSQGKEASLAPTQPPKMENPPTFVNTGMAVETVKGTDPPVTAQPTDLRCTVCNITVNSAQQLTQHLTSKKHQYKENGAKRSTPYYRPQRGGRGRGGAGAPGPYGAPGPHGPQGAPGGGIPGGRGRGRGRGGWGAGPKPGPAGVNSLKSNFQSAGFTSNFQGLEGSQSLKRDRSPRNAFGNGIDDHQRGKIPRGPQSAPFNSQDSMGHTSFRGGNHSFGGATNSFGGNKNSFGGSSNNFGSGNSNFGGANKFGGGSSNFGGGNSSFGTGNNSFGSASGFGGGNKAFGGGSNSFGGGSNSFGGGNSSFGGGNNAFGGQSGFGSGGGNSFQDSSSFGETAPSFRGGFGRGKMRGGPATRGNRARGGRGFGSRGGFAAGGGSFANFPS